MALGFESGFRLRVLRGLSPKPGPETCRNPESPSLKPKSKPTEKLVICSPLGGFW